MTWYKWGLVGLGAALVIAGLGAALVYFVRTSNDQVIAAYAKGNAALVTEGVVRSRADSARWDSVLKVLSASNQHAAEGQHQDVVIKVDSGLVIAVRDSLRQATSAADSLLRYPKIVTADSVTIADVTSARNDWRTAFNGQAQANASLIAQHASDTTFQHQLLAHLDSLPKPARTGLASFLFHPKPYVRGGYNTHTGLYGEGGMCLGACQ